MAIYEKTGSYKNASRAQRERWLKNNIKIPIALHNYIVQHRTTRVNDFFALQEQMIKGLAWDVEAFVKLLKDIEFERKWRMC